MARKKKPTPRINDTETTAVETVEVVEQPPAVEAPEQAPTRTRHTWLIDPGHGPRTHGKRSPKLEDGTRYYEWQFNQDIAERLLAKCRTAGIDAKITLPEFQRRGDDLIQRARAANEGRHTYPPIFVSIHSNSSPTLNENTWGQPSGTETWHFYGSKKGQEIAEVFQRHLVAATGLRDRGLKSKPNGQFYVLRVTHMPAILTESGFHNNKVDIVVLLSEESREAIAHAHFLAICEVENFSADAIA